MGAHIGGRMVVGMRSIVFLIAGCAVVATLSAPSRLLAQTDSSQDNPWKATGQRTDTTGKTNPTRSSSSHDVFKGRTVDRSSTQHMGVDGRYVPYQDVERESTQVDSTTTRILERTYGRGPDGTRVLTQATETEQRKLPGGGQKVTRTTSNPDANGRLQVIQREMQESRQISKGVTETKSTVLLPDLNGGLSATMQTQERSTQSGNDLEYRKTVQLPDGNGGWRVGEVRQGTIHQQGKEQTREEKVLRPGINGALTVVERTVQKESETAPGESHASSETYSSQLPGSSSDGGLRLAEKVSTVRRTESGGGQVTQQRVERPNPGNPSDGLQVMEATIDIVRTNPDGTTVQKTTILAPTSNGSLGEVWVDTKKVTGSPAIQVDTRTADKPH